MKGKYYLNPYTNTPASGTLIYKPSLAKCPHSEIQSFLKRKIFTMFQIKIFLVFLILIQIGISLTQKQPVVLVISFDGFRYDYMSKTETPNLDNFANEGVRVPYMEVQFPTKTFPNHQSMATGLYPINHGITDNRLFDPLHNRTLSGFNDDPEFWNYHPNILPFWLRNEDAGNGRFSGCFLWAGSSIGYGENGTRHPKYYIPTYDESIPWNVRVETVISWMKNETAPANLVYLYHNEPDTHGHRYGTEDNQTLAEIRNVDERVGVLITALKAANLYDNLIIIIVADHGMQTVTRQNMINITAIMDRNRYTNYGGTPVYQIIPKNSTDLNSIYNTFKNASTGKSFSVYKKEEMSFLNFYDNRRIMDIILLAEPGYVFDDMNFGATGIAGVHGYDPKSQNMRALFLARGPLFKKNTTLTESISNLDLVPLLSKILDVPEPPNNGSLTRICGVLESGDCSGASRIMTPLLVHSFIPFLFWLYFSNFLY